MNAHRRHGYSHSDVVDYRFTHCHRDAPRNRDAKLLRSAARLLSAANNHIVHAMRYTHPVLTANGYYSREDHIDAAKGYLRRAREWRLELQGDKAGGGSS
jgi:hypothetical protein